MFVGVVIHDRFRSRYFAPIPPGMRSDQAAEAIMRKHQEERGKGSERIGFSFQAADTLIDAMIACGRL